MRNNKLLLTTLTAAALGFGGAAFAGGAAKGGALSHSGSGSTSLQTKNFSLSSEHSGSPADGRSTTTTLSTAGGASDTRTLSGGNGSVSRSNDLTSKNYSRSVDGSATNGSGMNRSVDTSGPNGGSRSSQVSASKQNGVSYSATITKPDGSSKTYSNDKSN